MAGINLNLVTVALVDQEGLSLVVVEAGQLDVEAELCARTTVVRGAGAPGRCNQLDVSVLQGDHAVLVNHGLAINTRVEAQDLGGLVLATSTGDDHAVLWLQESGELQGQDILLHCASRGRHDVGGPLARSVEADATSGVGSAGEDDVFSRDAEVAVAFAVFFAELDVEVELLTFAKLAVVVLLGRGEDLQGLCACEGNILLIMRQIGNVKHGAREH